MFGNAPRAVWSRWLAPDELGRVPLACRVLLIETENTRTLFETGIGSFFEPELKDRYGVVESDHMLLSSLGRLGLTDADVDRVVLSHLHFDHAGGLLAPFERGRDPRLLFPRAEFVVGRSAFERAVRPHPRDRASFIPALPALLEASGRLRIVENEVAASEHLGGPFSFVETYGHTPGMLHASVSGKSARLLFCADLIPGTAWVHVPITMGYDRYPEKLVDEKAELLAEAEREKTVLVYTHDPVVAGSRVLKGKNGRFEPVEPVVDFTRWDIDRERLPSVPS